MILITTFTIEERAMQEQHPTVTVQKHNPILTISPYKTVFNLYN